MRIAVTAASGQLGRAVVRALLTEAPGAAVVGLARTPEKAADLGVEVRPGDYGDRAALERSLTGVDRVLLISGMDAPDERIVKHRNVIEAAKAAGVERLVYSSIFGKDDVAEGSAKAHGFMPIVNSNRQTERDVAASGLDWTVGRNGLYIEPDVEYLEHYVGDGRVANCAGDGRCGYTTRDELGYAYAKLLTGGGHIGRTYTLTGEPITQARLTELLNLAFGTDLVFEPLSVDAYRAERQAALGEFLGTAVAGIYEGIGQGAMDVPSDFAAAAGREHVAWEDYFRELKG